MLKMNSKRKRKECHSDSTSKKRKMSPTVLFLSREQLPLEATFNKTDTIATVYCNVTGSQHGYADNEVFTFQESIVNGDSVIAEFIIDDDSVLTFEVHSSYFLAQLYCFWNSPHTGDVPEPGSLMNIQDWFRPTPKRRPHIFVRQCFKETFEEHVQLFLLGDRTCIDRDEVLYITGAPGIGKTRFLYYMLCRLIKFRRPIVLTFGRECVYFKDKWPTLIKPYDWRSIDEGAIAIYDPNNIDHPLDWYVSDEANIVIASPDPIHLKPVKNCNKKTVVMDVWEYEEIKECHGLMYTDISLDNVQTLYDNWGHAPRCCFEGKNRYYEEKLQKCLASRKKVEDICLRMASEGPFLDDHPLRNNQWIANMTKDGRVCWATDYIKANFFANSTKIFTSLRHRSKLIHEQSNIELGHCYEAYIKSVFMGQARSIDRTKRLKVIPLNPTTGGSRKFPWPSNVAHFSTDEIHNEVKSGALYLPRSTNFATVDMVYPPYLFQITTANDHSVTTRGLERVKAIFPKIDSWNLIFIAPSKRKETFQIKKKGRDVVMKHKMATYLLTIDHPEVQIITKDTRLMSVKRCIKQLIAKSRLMAVNRRKKQTKLTVKKDISNT